MTSTRDADFVRGGRLREGRIKLKSLANFCRQAAISIHSGLALSRALPLLAEGTQDRRLKRALKAVHDDISRGSTLAEALRNRGSIFPPMLVEMAAAGETSGHLEEVFSRLAIYFDTRLKLRRGVIRASIYPAIQLTFAYAVWCLIAILFSSDKAGTAENLAYSTALFAIAFLVVRYFFTRTEVGRAIWDRVLLSVPLIRSVTLKLCMARFSRSLAMQIDSAIPITEAIERAARVTGNGAVGKSLRRIAEPVRHGANLSEALKSSNLVTPMVREVLTIGDETGSFIQSLERVADIYEDESLLVLESIPKLIGPIVVLIVGAIVIYLFYTVYYVHYLKPLLDMLGT